MRKSLSIAPVYLVVAARSAWGADVAPGPAAALGASRLASFATMADGSIALACFVIAGCLASVWFRGRRELPLPWLATAGAGAVFSFACGTSHLVDASMTPSSAGSSLAATIKFLTALVSIGIAVALPSLMPRFRRLVSDRANAPDAIGATAEHHPALQAALRAKTAAEESSRSKDEFLALLSHELRTPLQAMTTWLEIAEREEADAVPAQVRRALAALRRTAVALGRLVEDLLDSSRIVVGKLSLETTTFDPVETVASTVNAMLAVAEERGITLEIGERTSGAVVAGDPRRLGQAIRALIDNALKFTAKGGRVVVDTHREKGGVEIAVSDDGSGIPPEMLPRIFDRFTQGDTSRSRRQSGLGLGLFLVKSIIERHDGRVAAESAGIGQGATFRIWLPIAAGAEAQPMVEVAVRPEGRLTGVRILLVEDDLSTAEAMEEILSEDGAKVETVASAAAARALFRRKKLDLVISDIGLPDEDGISLIHDLRQREEETGRDRTPAVAMSGYTSPGEVADMIAAGFDQHVAKPIADFDAFRALLAALAAARRG